MSSLFKVILFVAILSFSGLQVQGQQKKDSLLFWPLSTHNFSGRLLYSQAILWPTSIAGHVGLYILKEDFDWSRAVTLRMYERSFTSWPRLDKDHWSWNYEVHPIMGSFSYLSFRNRGASVLESIGGTALNSLIYEYLIAGGTQTPSWNDMVVTPIGGALLGEGIYQLKRFFVRDRYLTLVEKVIITVADPFDWFFHGCNYSKLIRSYSK